VIFGRRQLPQIDPAEARRIEQQLQLVRTLAATIIAKAEAAQARIYALSQRESRAND